MGKFAGHHDGIRGGTYGIQSIHFRLVLALERKNPVAAGLGEKLGELGVVRMFQLLSRSEGHMRARRQRSRRAARPLSPRKASRAAA